jgi:hypothetical protein
MKLLILAVLLSFVHPFIGSPLTIKDEASTSDHNTGPANQKGQVQLARAIATYGYQKQQEARHKQPSSANDDPNYVLWGFWVNAVLVFATLIIAVFAVVQARAAKLNAQSVIDAERAWLLVEDVKLIPNGVDEPSHVPLPGSLCFAYTIQNYGKTPGTILATKAELQVGANPSRPPDSKVYEVAGAVAEQSILPQEQSRERTSCVRRIASEERRAIFNTGESDLWACGSIWYEDSFKTRRETFFCYRFGYDPRFAERVSRQFFCAGPSAYNEAT